MKVQEYLIILAVVVVGVFLANYIAKQTTKA